MKPTITVLVLAWAALGLAQSHAQEEGLPAEILLDRYLSELDHSGGFMRYMHALGERPDEARIAIEARLDALEAGTDPYSWVGGEPTVENRYERGMMGAAVHALGQLGAFLGDDEFAHSVWRRAVILALNEDLSVHAIMIVGDFIRTARVEDVDLLREIVGRRSEFTPGIGKMADRALAGFAEGKVEPEAAGGIGRESATSPSAAGEAKRSWELAIGIAAAIVLIAVTVAVLRRRGRKLAMARHFRTL